MSTARKIKDVLFSNKNERKNSLEKPLLPSKDIISETKIDILEPLVYVPPILPRKEIGYNAWTNIANYFSIEDAIQFSLTSKENQQIINKHLNHPVKYKAMMSIQYPHKLALIKQSQHKLDEINHLISQIEIRINKKVKKSNSIRSSIVWTIAVTCGILFVIYAPGFETREDKEMVSILAIFPGLAFLAWFLDSIINTNNHAVKLQLFKNSFLFPFDQNQIKLINEHGPILNETRILDILNNLNDTKKNLDVVIKEPADESMQIKKCLSEDLTKQDLPMLSFRLFKDLFQVPNMVEKKELKPLAPA